MLSITHKECSWECEGSRTKEFAHVIVDCPIIGRNSFTNKSLGENNYKQTRLKWQPLC